jgi:hypothetical protein
VQDTGGIEVTVYTVHKEVGSRRIHYIYTKTTAYNTGTDISHRKL